jgi:hypothetical protein
MSAIRKFAVWLLNIALRHAPAESRDWAEAMLRELDFIESDWAAFFWALGCTGAISWECLRGWATWLHRQFAELFGIQSSKEEIKMNSTGKKTLGVLAGMGLALALGVGAFFLRHPIGDMLLAVGIQKTMWSHVLTVILPTELIVVVAAILLWRRQRAPIAVGMLLTGLVMGVHVIVSVAGH